MRGCCGTIRWWRRTSLDSCSEPGLPRGPPPGQPTNGPSDRRVCGPVTTASRPTRPHGAAPSSLGPPMPSATSRGSRTPSPRRSSSRRSSDRGIGGGSGDGRGGSGRPAPGVARDGGDDARARHRGSRSRGPRRARTRPHRPGPTAQAPPEEAPQPDDHDDRSPAVPGIFQKCHRRPAHAQGWKGRRLHSRPREHSPGCRSSRGSPSH